MIVELTWGQSTALAPALKELGCDDLYQHFVAPSGSHTHWVALPAIAWTQLSSALEKKAFNAGGYRRKHISPNYHSLIRRINQQLARVIGHPAMWGGFEPGASNEIFIAWPTGAKGKDAPLFTPFPIPGRDLVVLEPDYAKRTLDMGGGPAEWDVTVWEPRPPFVAPEVFGLFPSPFDHYRFVGVTPSGGSDQRSTAP